MLKKNIEFCLIRFFPNVISMYLRIIFHVFSTKILLFLFIFFNPRGVVGVFVVNQKKLKVGKMRVKGIEVETERIITCLLSCNVDKAAKGVSVAA